MPSRMLLLPLPLNCRCSRMPDENRWQFALPFGCSEVDWKECQPLQPARVMVQTYIMPESCSTAKEIGRGGKRRKGDVGTIGRFFKVLGRQVEDDIHIP